MELPTRRDVVVADQRQAFPWNALHLFVATAVIGVVGLALLRLIKQVVEANAPDFEVEHLFGNARLMSAALTAVGILIIPASIWGGRGDAEPTTRRAPWMGAVQGLCLPFRGFSGSGETVSTGLLLGVVRRRAEEFSFALAVLLTPAVVAREVLRLYQSRHAASVADSATLLNLAGPSLIGMGLSFPAGLAALRWLS